jgi:glycosyltransferase involved in cell wall biosynthesis
LSVRRVLMTADAVGGVWTYSLELTKFLRAADSDVHLCVLGPRPNEQQERDAEAAGAASISVPCLPLEWTAHSEDELDELAEDLQDRACKCQADLAHLNAPAQVGMRGWPLPLAVTAHSCVGTWWAAAGNGPMPHDLAWRARRTGVGMTLADAVIAPSKAFARDLASIYGELIPFTAIHNGRSASAPTLEDKGDLLLTAGRLWDSGKNATIIGAAARICGATIYAAGPTCGPNGEMADLSHLELLGSLDPNAMANWHRRTGIFVSMSNYEPFGLAVLEAAQAGSALVLSDIATFRELWDGAAIFVEPNNAAQLADAIRDLQRDSTRRRELGAAATARANDYNLEAMGERTLDAYGMAMTTDRALEREGARA